MKLVNMGIDVDVDINVDVNIHVDLMHSFLTDLTTY